MLDRQVFDDFAAEVRSAVSAIQRAIGRATSAQASTEDVQEAHRLVHTVRGAAAIVGLSELSDVAHALEAMLEPDLQTTAPLPEATGALVASTAGDIGAYVELLVTNQPTEELLGRMLTAVCAYQGGQTDGDLEALGGLRQDDGDDTAAADGQSAPHGRQAAVDEHIEVRAAVAVSPDLADVFEEEAREHLRQIATLVTQLQQTADDRDALQSLRRSVHTLKGAAGMVGFTALSRLAHRSEDLLDHLYDAGEPLDKTTHSVIISAADTFDDLITGCDDYDALRCRVLDLYRTFDDLLASPTSTARAKVDETITAADEPDVQAFTSAEGGEPADPAPVMVAAEVLAPVPQAHEAQPTDSGREKTALPVVAAPRTVERRRDVRRRAEQRNSDQIVRVPFDRLDDVVKLISELVINRSTFEQHYAGLIRQVEELNLSTKRLRRVTSKIESQYEVRALATQIPHSTGTDQAAHLRLTTHVTHGFDELEFDRYTEFHLLSRELAETASDIGTVGARLRDSIADFDSDLTRLGRLTGEVQDKVMQFRMLPLASLATRLERTVRVTATECGKTARLALEGSDVALDKAVLEGMADPLLHMLRNAVDHGLEQPDVRVAHGKPAEGRVVVRAGYEGTQVIIQIEDDGGGLDVDRIRATAVSRGLVTAEAADSMPDSDVFSFIFEPGFSTAREVSEISGRGVGMDVVRSRVEQLKGRVSVDTKRGLGTTVTVRLPMTLAIARVLLVRTGPQTFAVPMAAVLTIVKRSRNEVMHVGTEPVVSVDDRVYPLLELADSLGVHADEAQDSDATRPVLLLRLGDRQIAVVADEIIESRDVVVKSLGNHLRRVHGFSGATLLGDGSVVLIVNPDDLGRKTDAPRVARTSVKPSIDRTPYTIMVVDDSLSVRHVLSNLIRRAGWNVVQARDGVEALEVLHRADRNPDVILLDIEMPRMDGYELTSTLRAQAQHRDIPIVMITSRAGEKHRQKALTLGATEYMVKPFQDDVLLDRVERLARAVRAGAVVAA